MATVQFNVVGEYQTPTHLIDNDVTWQLAAVRPASMPTVGDGEAKFTARAFGPNGERKFIDLLTTPEGAVSTFNLTDAPAPAPKA